MGVKIKKIPLAGIAGFKKEIVNGSLQEKASPLNFVP
jgi:hypothetical protein